MPLSGLGSNPSSSNSRFIAPVVISLVLQVALASHISILGGTFNLAVALACALALALTPGQAALAGFALGLFFDLTNAVPVGLMSFLLTIAAFALAGASGGHALGFTSDGIRLTAAAVLVVCLAYGFASFLLGVDTSFVSSVFGHGLATGILSVIASLPLLACFGSGDAGRGFSAARHGSRYKGLR